MGRSGGGPAAVDGEERAGDEGGFVGGQVTNHGRDLLGLAEAADGLAGTELGAHLFLIVLVEFFEIAFDEGGLDGAGADGVDAQVFGEFDGKLAGHGDDRALGGAVSESLLDADQAGDGGDVDDRGDALVGVGKQQWQECAGDEVDAADIDVEEAVEVVGLGGLNGANVANAGVVDEQVEAGELGCGGGDGIGAGDVEVESFGGAEGLGEGFGGGEVDVGDIDECAGAYQFFGGGFTDAAGAAGDEGLAVVEAEGMVVVRGSFCGGSNCFSHGCTSRPMAQAILLVDCGTGPGC